MAKITNKKGNVPPVALRFENVALHLRLENTWFKGLEVALKKKITVIGRSVTCDICLDDRLVSDEQAVIIRTNMGMQIINLCGRKGLKVNSRTVYQSDLRPGDVIEIGNFQMTLCS